MKKSFYFILSTFTYCVLFSYTALATEDISIKIVDYGIYQVEIKTSVETDYGRKLTLKNVKLVSHTKKYLQKLVWTLVRDFC